MAKLSYAAITVIAIVVAGAVVLMILTCAMQMRKHRIGTATTEIHDADMSQLKYMQEVRQRQRVEMTGTDPRAWRSDVPSYHSHPSSPGPSRQMLRSALSNHGDGGYGDVYSPGFETPTMSMTMQRNGSSYMHAPDMEYGGIPYGNPKGGMAETTYEASPVAGPGDYVVDERDEHDVKA